MELRARTIGKKSQEKKRRPSAPPSAALVTSAKEEAAREGPHYSITVRYGTFLYDTLQNMIRSSHTAQDFTYTSPADFIRAALRAYKDGMVLTELDQSGPKLETSLRVDRELWLFYKSLPGRMRSKILERVIRTFMKQQSEAVGKGRAGASGSKGGRRKKAWINQGRMAADSPKSNPRRHAPARHGRRCPPHPLSRADGSAEASPPQIPGAGV